MALDLTGLQNKYYTYKDEDKNEDNTRWRLLELTCMEYKLICWGHGAQGETQLVEVVVKTRKGHETDW